MSLESDKALGGVGALLIAIGSFFPFLSLVGIILVLIAMKGLAEHYQDPSIYRNALYGFIFGIIGIVAAIALFISAFLLGGFLVPFAVFAPFAAGGFFIAIIGILFVVFIFFLIQAIFYRNAFTALSQKSGEGLFATAGLLLLIGAILTIVIIGLLLLFIAWIIATVAFFSIRTPSEITYATGPPPPPPSTPSTTAQKKFCPNCGAENTLDAKFCTYCGKKL